MNKYKAIRAAIRAGIYEPKTAVNWIWDTFGVDIGMGEFTVIMKDILTEEPAKPPKETHGCTIGCLILIIIFGIMFFVCAGAVTPPRSYNFSGPAIIPESVPRPERKEFSSGVTPKIEFKAALPISERPPRKQFSSGKPPRISVQD